MATLPPGDKSIRERGLTIIEIVIFLGIASVIMGASILGFKTYERSAIDQRVKTDLAIASTGMMNWANEYGGLVNPEMNSWLTQVPKNVRDRLSSDSTVEIREIYGNGFCLTGTSKRLPEVDYTYQTQRGILPKGVECNGEIVEAPPETTDPEPTPTGPAPEPEPTDVPTDNPGTDLLLPADPVISGEQTGVNKATFTWAPDDEVDNYLIATRCNAAAFSTNKTVTSTTADVTCAPGQTAAIRVIAVNSEGRSGDAIGSVNLAMTVVAPTPTIEVNQDSGEYTVTWADVAGAGSYTSRQRINSGGWDEDTDASSPLKGTLNPGDSVEVIIGSIGMDGAPVWSESVFGQRTPDAPEIAAAIDQATGQWTASWSAVNGAASYQARHRVVGSGDWIQVDNISALQHAGSADWGQTIEIQVRTANGGGVSEWSSSASVVRKPGIPTMTATYDEGAGQWKADWSAVGGATSYLLQSKLGDAAWVDFPTTALTGSGSLLNGESVQIRVAAANESGQSDWSAIKTLSSLPLPPEVDFTVDQATGVWNAAWGASPGATGYDVRYRVLPSTVWITTPITETSFSGTLGNGETMRVQVRAKNGAGTGNWSTYVETTRVPSAPTLEVAIDNVNTRWTAKWTAQTGATSYLIAYKTDGDWIEYSSTSLTYENLLEYGKPLTVRVASVNAGGQSDWFTAPEQWAAPWPPEIEGTLNSTTGDLVLKWDKPASTTEYRITTIRNEIEETSEVSTTDQTYTANLAFGDEYVFILTAVGPGGPSFPTAYQIKRDSEFSQPEAPTNLNLTLTNGASWAASWTADKNATQYAYQVNINDGGWGQEIITDGTSVTGASQGGWIETVQIRVRAFNPGLTSGWAEKTVVGPPAAPSITTFTTMGSNWTAIWSSSAINLTKYIYEVQYDGGAWVRTDNGTKTNAAKPAPAGAVINFRVAVITPGGQSAWATATATAPPVAAGLNVSSPNDDQTVVATFPATGPGITQEILQRSSVGTLTVHKVPDNYTSFTFHNGANQTYEYAMRVTNTSGTSTTPYQSITTTWNTPLALAGNWTNYNSIYGPPRYSRSTDGMISLAGVVKGGGMNEAIATLPPGYRPAERMVMYVSSSSPGGGDANAYGRVDVLPDGRVYNISGSTVWIALDSIVFRPAAVIGGVNQWNVPNYPITRIQPQNGWTNYSDNYDISYASLGMTRDRFGRIAAQGLLSTGTQANGTLIGAAPWASQSYEHRPAMQGTTAHLYGMDEVQKGIVAKGAATGTWLSIQGIHNDVAQSATWTALPLENGWIAHGARYTQPSFRYISDGMVSLEGLVRAPAGFVANTRDQVITRIPPGYRPEHRTIQAQVSSVGNSRVDILPTGEIISAVNSGAGGWSSLDNTQYQIGLLQQTDISSTVLASSPETARFSWVKLPRSETTYTFQYRINGGAWVSALTSSTATYFDIKGQHGNTVEGRVFAINSDGTSAGSYTTRVVPQGVSAPLTSTWKPYGSPYGDPTYTKTSAGLVMLTGLTGSVGATATGTIFTLPVGYRPDVTMIYPAAISANGVSRLSIFPDGRVVLSATTAWVSLENISFLPRESQIGRVDLAPLNGYSNYSTGDTGHGSLRVYKDSLGRAYSSGLTNNGPAGDNITIANLPSGFSSTYQMHMPSLRNGDLSSVQKMVPNVLQSGPFVTGVGWSSQYNWWYPGTTGAWTNIPTQNGWATRTQPLQFTKSPDGIITLRGLLNPGTTATNTLIGTLPSAYRPDRRVILHVMSGYGNIRVDVLADGRIIIGGNSTGSWTTFDGLSFVQSTS